MFTKLWISFKNFGWLWLGIGLILIMYVTMCDQYCENFTPPVHNNTALSTKSTGSTLEQCLNKCKIMRGCTASFYHKPTKRCYLTSNTLDDSCLKKTDYTVCLKPYNTYQSQLYPSDSEKRAHSLFVCQDENDTAPKYYYDYNGKLHRVQEKLQLDIYPVADDYVIRNDMVKYKFVPHLTEAVIVNQYT